MNHKGLKLVLFASVALAAIGMLAPAANAGWWWGAAPSYSGCDSCGGGDMYGSGCGCGGHHHSHHGGYGGCGGGCGCYGGGWTAWNPCCGSCYSTWTPSCCGCSSWGTSRQLVRLRRRHYIRNGHDEHDGHRRNGAQVVDSGPRWCSHSCPGPGPPGSHAVRHWRSAAHYSAERYYALAVGPSDSGGRRRTVAAGSRRIVGRGS